MDERGGIQRRSPKAARRSRTSPFAGWLRTERERRTLTRADLAWRSGVSVMQIGNLENGRTLNPRRTTRDKLAKAFELEIPAAVATESEREVADHGFGSLMKFDPHDENELPEVVGVYVFYDIYDRPVYVGMSSKQSIRDRVREHYEKFWFKRPIVDRATCVEIQDEKLGAQVGQILVHTYEVRGVGFARAASPKRQPRGLRHLDTRTRDGSPPLRWTPQV